MDNEKVKEIIKNGNKSCDDVLDYQKKELIKISTGKASANIFDELQVDYYGEKTPLYQTSSIKVIDATTIIISPYDKNTVKDVVAAINNAHLELKPQDEGDKIRINIPPLTEERRIDLTKRVKEVDEQSKVKIRQIRHEVLKKLKNIELSENEEKYWNEEIEKNIKNYISKIETKSSEKNKEITTI